MSVSAATQPAPRTLWRDDLVAALTGGLLILGLFLDGWNHLNLQNGKAGEFLTPWHGLLYAGFNACAIWAITRNARLRAMMFKRPGSAGAGVGAKRAPQFNAAHVALLGLGLAGAGVIGDAIARASGVVASEGAMRPPFDFLLFTGAGLLLAIALRSAASQIEGFGKRVALPAVVGIGGAAAVVFAFGGPAATKSVDHVVRTIAAQPSVVQSAPRTAPAVRHARHAAVRAHHHRVAASTHAHRARSAAHGHASKSVSVSAAATTTTTHHASSHHATRTVVVHRRATRHASAAPVRRSAPRPAPHRTHAKSKGRFQQVAIPDVPSAAPSTSASAPSSSSGSSSSAPAATSPAASPTAAPTPTTSNPPASANPPATPPTAAKHGGPGQG